MGDVGLWLTGLAWIWVAFRLAYDRVPTPQLDSAAELWRFSAKVAVPYAIAIAVLAGIFRPDPVPVLGSGLSGTLPTLGTTGWTVAAALFLALVTSFAVTVVIASRKHGMSPAELIGVDAISVPPLIRAAWAGAVRTFAVAVPALLCLVFIGTFLDFVDSGIGFGSLVALLLSLLLAGVFWAGIDVAFVFMVSAMRFLSDDLVGFDPPVWTWAGIAIVAIAFALGGRLAAERLPAADGRGAVAAGALVGPMVAIIAFVASWFAIGVGEQLVGPALGLPVLWSAASAAGGLIYANQRGLAMGIQVETRRSPGTDE